MNVLRVTVLSALWRFTTRSDTQDYTGPGRPNRKPERSMLNSICALSYVVFALRGGNKGGQRREDL